MKIFLNLIVICFFINTNYIFAQDTSFISINGSANLNNFSGWDNPNNKYWFKVKLNFYQNKYDKTVFFANDIFDSLVDFSNVQFDNIVHFSKSEFYGPVNFEKALFNKESYFLDTKFLAGKIVFFNSVFLGIANFDNAVFKNKVVFLKTEFKDFVYFKKTHFIHQHSDTAADFSKAIFDSLVDFSEAIFDTLSTFNKTVFKDKVIFNKTRFEGIVDFDGATFLNSAVFINSQFNSGTDFSNVIFNEIASFRNAAFAGNVNFKNAILPDTLNLRDIKNIKNEIDFTSSKLNDKKSKCYINLWGTNIDKIKIDYTRFRLYFHNDDSLTIDQKSGIYYSLLEKFKRDGFTESYKLLDIEFRNFKACNGNIWDKFLNCLNYLWWNYGYSKELIFVWIIFFVSIFTIIIFFNFEYLLLNIYQIEFIHNYINKVNTKNKRNKLTYSLIYCLVIFFGFKLDLDGIKSINRWLFFIMIVYSTGLICAAYLFNFIINK